MFKSIGDVLYRSSNFKAVITMFIDNTGVPETQNPGFKRPPLVNIYPSKNPNEMSSVYFDTYSRSLIGFCEIAKDSTGMSKQSSQIFFSQKFFHEIDDALEICISWLKSKNFKYLFNVDSEGIVKGLGASAPYNPAVYKNHFEYIRFHPAVVKDYNGIAYEGISIRTQKGSIAQFTCGEFLTFAAAIRGYIRNQYGNNLSLLNTALTYFMASKLKK